MKNLFIIVRLPKFFILMFTILFTACSSDDIKLKEENPIEKEYFKIEESTYKTGTMLESTSDVELDNVVFENNALFITSTQECELFYIGVQGVSGYYEVEANHDVVISDGIHKYIIAINLVRDNVDIVIKSKYVDGSISILYIVKISGPNTPETPTIHARTIDLGLSVKWASCNLGAKEPWEFGDYYAWGETEIKSLYDWSTYKYFTQNAEMSKYNNNVGSYYFDNKTTLESSDDVVQIEWGRGWRMPTEQEINELCQSCTWEWITLNGTEGCRVIGPNGNSIFLPAAGYKSSEVWHEREFGYYLSSSLGSNSFYCCYMYFDSDSYGWSDECARDYGHTIRPVCP